MYLYLYLLCGLLSVACLIPDVSYLRFTADSMSSKVIKKQQGILAIATA